MGHSEKAQGWKAGKLESKIIFKPFSLIASKLPSIPACEAISYEL
jgi:hypothetical protein